MQNKQTYLSLIHTKVHVLAHKDLVVELDERERFAAFLDQR